MNVLEKFYVLAVLILYVQAEDGEVPKVSVKHFYTVEAKMDVVQNIAMKYFNSAILEKMVNKDLVIVSSGGVTAKVKDFFKENQISVKNTEELLKKENRTFDNSKILQSIQRHSDLLLKTFNFLSIQCHKSENTFDTKVQQIFDKILEIDEFVHELVQNLNAGNETDFEEKIEEAIINYSYRKLALKITNAIKTLPIGLIHSLMTKVLPNGVCNSKITRTQAIMQFYDFIMVKVIEAETFLLKCYELKEFMTGANLKKKKQYVTTSIDQNVQFFYAKVMSHIENFVVPDVPTDFDGPIDGCILDLECNYSERQCIFKNLNLQHEWSPITITTNQTTKPNDQINDIKFDSSSCTLSYIPHAIFDIFPNLNYMFDVVRTKLARLEPEFFLNANNLSSYFHCYYNNITALKARTFIHAPNLNHINLQENEIEYIDHQAFEGLSKLTVLILHANKIKALSVEVFRPMLKLNILFLQENPCINKHFPTSNAILTTLQKELEVNTKCSQNDDIHQFSKKLAKTEETIEKRLKIIESLNSFNITPIEKRLSKLEEKLDEMIKMIEKMVAPIQGPIEHNN